jgi:CBS domain-containing protein
MRTVAAVTAIGDGVHIALCIGEVAMNADEVPVTEMMSRELVTARVNTPVNALLRLMLLHHTSCIPIVDDNGRPVGIVTKSDVVDLLEAGRASADLSLQTAADLMMPLAITLHEHATVAHVARMMALEDFHHVMIVGEAGALVGVVSSQDVVRWVVNDR